MSKQGTVRLMSALALSFFLVLAFYLTLSRGTRPVTHSLSEFGEVSPLVTPHHTDAQRTESPHLPPATPNTPADPAIALTACKDALASWVAGGVDNFLQYPQVHNYHLRNWTRWALKDLIPKLESALSGLTNEERHSVLVDLFERVDSDHMRGLQMIVTSKLDPDYGFDLASKALSDIDIHKPTDLHLFALYGLGLSGTEQGYHLTLKLLDSAGGNKPTDRLSFEAQRVLQNSLMLYGKNSFEKVMELTTAWLKESRPDATIYYDLLAGYMTPDVVDNLRNVIGTTQDRQLATMAYNALSNSLSDEQVIQLHLDHLTDPRLRQTALVGLLVKAPELHREYLEKNFQDWIRTSKDFLLTLGHLEAMGGQFAGRIAEKILAGDLIASFEPDERQLIMEKAVSVALQSGDDKALSALARLLSSDSQHEMVTRRLLTGLGQMPRIEPDGAVPPSFLGGINSILQNEVIGRGEPGGPVFSILAQLANTQADVMTKLSQLYNSRQLNPQNQLYLIASMASAGASGRDFCNRVLDTEPGILPRLEALKVLSQGAPLNLARYSEKSIELGRELVRGGTIASAPVYHMHGAAECTSVEGQVNILSRVFSQFGTSDQVPKWLALKSELLQRFPGMSANARKQLLTKFDLAADTARLRQP